MKKIILSLALTVMLFSGCSDTAESTNSLGGPSQYCIDGVTYIRFGYGGAPWINPNTMTFSKCQVIDGKLTIIK